MESLTEEDLNSNVKKTKLNFSHVHDEFDVIENFWHVGQEKFMEGRKCKECGAEFPGKNATNLKNHLRSKHDERFQRVKSKTLKSFDLFLIVNCV